MRQKSQYVILDVPDQDALHTIARAVANERVLCGSSALAEALPDVWGPTHAVSSLTVLPPDGKGILCIAGSLTPQTVAQIEHLRSRGQLAVEVDTQHLFEPHQRQVEIGRVANLLVEPIMQGEAALVHSPNDAKTVVATRAAGMRAGKSPHEVARLVTDTLAEIVVQVIKLTNTRRLVVAGGETSGAVCRRLGVTGLRIWKEIQPGLPSCLTLTNPPLLLVLKSGSFGTADFLEQAQNHLSAQP
jgi:uncharacterized protein YgbK (DUF1537 family)